MVAAITSSLYQVATSCPTTSLAVVIGTLAYLVTRTCPPEDEEPQVEPLVSRTELLSRDDGICGEARGARRELSSQEKAASKANSLRNRNKAGW
jgi:hypothetical protein